MSKRKKKPITEVNGLQKFELLNEGYEFDGHFNKRELEKKLKREAKFKKDFGKDNITLGGNKGGNVL